MRRPRVVILTGSELRHTYFRVRLAQHEDIEVALTCCEGLEKSLTTLVEKRVDNTLQRLHLDNRRQSERDFFELYVDACRDDSHPVFLPKGAINEAKHVDAIIDTAPDLVIAYGCSIIHAPLLDVFEGRFLNVHLGLSPYYRGSGTNFWPLVNGQPELVGATFMHIDAGIDTGDVIHQMRARVVWGDTPAQIGNRLIREMTDVYGELIRKFDRLVPMEQIPVPDDEHYYRRRDLTEESVAELYRSFRGGLVDKYLENCELRCSRVPIIENPSVGSRIP
jgi:methionyl-tRNA formyltransferase